MKLETINNYKIKAPLAQTSWLDVYQATAPNSGQPVVIKLFKCPASSASGQQLLSQLRSSATLQHPYIAKIYEVGIADNAPFVVEEFIGNTTLAEYAQKHHAPEQAAQLSQIGRYLKLMAGALDYAHRQQVVHGNLTLDNIILTADIQEPVLTGFGQNPLSYSSENKIPDTPADDVAALGLMFAALVSGSTTLDPDADPTAATLPTAKQQVALEALATVPAGQYPDATTMFKAYSQAVGEATPEEETVPQLQSKPMSINRYKIEAELGRRDSLIVYKAFDAKLNRYVAIKITPPQHLTTQSFRTRFKQEVELIATLEHRFIVEVYDFGEIENRPYVVMPFMEGGTLETRLAAAGTLTPKALYPIVERVAAALDEAHARGIVHGQLMPGNILFDAEGQAYVSDFGLASIPETWTEINEQQNAAKASKYMSPEQVNAVVHGQSAQIDARTDIYALGVIIFEALTGKVPYLADTPYHTAMAHLEAAIPPLDSVNPDIPKAYQRLIERTLAKEPQARYPSAGTLAARLEELQAGRGHFGRISDLMDMEPLRKQIPPQTKATPSPTSKVAVSSKKFGRYLLKKELGRGGMGVVYLARDPSIKREVAIKVLPGNLAKAPDFRNQFQNEARLIAQLDHDCIAHVYDFGEMHGQLFLVMPYLPGGTLTQLLAKRRLKLRHIVPIIERIAQALDAAHEQHIIHYDVKPGNILFNDKGDAFLSDFGIALLQNDKSSNSEQAIAGTPKYMSPEQVKAMLRQIEISELDGRSDIYALGVVLFEMLTGQVPYQTKTPYKTALAHITQPVPELSSYAPNLPTACQEIISRALAKSPAERYDTAQALAADLKEASSGRWLLRQLID